MATADPARRHHRRHAPHGLRAFARQHGVSGAWAHAGNPTLSPRAAMNTTAAIRLRIFTASSVARYVGSQRRSVPQSMPSLRLSPRHKWTGRRHRRMKSARTGARSNGSWSPFGSSNSLPSPEREEGPERAHVIQFFQRAYALNHRLRPRSAKHRRHQASRLRGDQPPAPCNTRRLVRSASSLRFDIIQKGHAM